MFVIDTVGKRTDYYKDETIKDIVFEKNEVDIGDVFYLGIGKDTTPSIVPEKPVIVVLFAGKNGVREGLSEKDKIIKGIIGGMKIILGSFPKKLMISLKLRIFSAI